MKKQYKCYNCEKLFERYECHVRNPSRVFCSTECSNKYMSVTNSGENNPNYKHGKYYNPVCMCGNTKDPRSKQCSTCSRKSKGVGVIDVRTDEEIIDVVKECNSYSQVSKTLSVTREWVTKKIKHLDIDISHFVPCSHRPYDKKLVLSKDSKVSSGTLKRHIIDNNIIEYICHKCGNRGRWGGEELILELHHLDGIRNNNEVDNLEFLCPNCHAQTETHRGKNNKDKNRVGEK